MTKNDSCSEVGSVTVGVSQGSVLYINDICNAIPDTKIKLFADDSNLFKYDKSITNSTIEQTKVCHNYQSGF